MALTLMNAPKVPYPSKDPVGHVARAIVRDRHRMVDLRHERPLWEAQVGWCVFFEPSTREIFEDAGVTVPTM